VAAPKIWASLMANLKSWEVIEEKIGPGGQFSGDGATPDGLAGYSKIIRAKNSASRSHSDQLDSILDG
jgi:hypothetical protein